jgi:glycerol uptake facilitator-like aquaporin
MLQKYLVEFIGSLLFIYVILATNNPLAIGATLSLVILLTSKISGGYLNPAVTIAEASLGRLQMNEVLPYCLAQIIGGLAAFEIYKRVKI